MTLPDTATRAKAREIEAGARAILALVPVGYGMTEPEARQYAKAVIDSLLSSGGIDGEPDWQLHAMLETVNRVTAMAASGVTQFRSEARDGLTLSHLQDMHERAATGGFSARKLGRWLGWMQAVATAAGALTLDEAKQINRDASEGLGDRRPAPREATEGERLRAALRSVVDAKALAGVRCLVAGWNGEGKPDSPYERHPSRLGAHIETNCGAIYALDEVLVAARNLLASPVTGSE